MRNVHSWILAVPFVWSLAASPASSADPVTLEPAAPPQMLEESCGTFIGNVFAVNDASGQERTLQGVVLPTVVAGSKVSPTFSEAAVKAGGKVSLRGIVCKDGSITSVQVLHAPTPDVGTAAADALRKWKFNPAMKDGQAVAVRYMVSFDVKP